MSTENEQYRTALELARLQAALDLHLEIFGDELAKRNKYAQLQGLDAVRYYLLCKFNWTTSVVRAMSRDDLRFALSEELSGWTAPKAVQIALERPESEGEPISPSARSNAGRPSHRKTKPSRRP